MKRENCRCKQVMKCYNSSTMSTAIDISKIPALAHLVEEVETTKKPRELKRADKVVAVLSPVTYDRSKTDLMKFFGCWKDVDTERLKEDIYTDRTRNAKSPA